MVTIDGHYHQAVVVVTMAVDVVPRNYNFVMKIVFIVDFMIKFKFSCKGKIFNVNTITPRPRHCSVLKQKILAFATSITLHLTIKLQ